MKASTVLTRFLNERLAWLKYQVRLVKVGAKRGNPLFVGIGSTKLFLTFVGVMALLPQKDEEGWAWRIWSFIISPPNEIGDTLAGIAGALAFLWIIVTVMIQSKELVLTRGEMEEQKKATQDMAKAMADQLIIFKCQQDERDQDNTKRKFEELLKTIQFKCNEIQRLERGVIFERSGDEDFQFRLFGDKPYEDNETLLCELSFLSGIYVVHLHGAFTEHCKLLVKEKFNKILLNLNELISDTLVLETSLSEDQKIRLRRYDLVSVKRNFELILDFKIWEDQQTLTSRDVLEASIRDGSETQ